MAVIAGIINGTNLNRDYHFQSLSSEILKEGVREGFDNELEVTAGQVANGMAFIEVTRTNITPNEVFLVVVRVTGATSVDTTGDGYIIISLDQAKINDGSGNSTDGTGIAIVEKVSSLPSSNYIQLASLSSGVITNIRVYSKIDGTNIELASTTPTLELTGNELDVKIKVAGGLLADSGGLYVDTNSLPNVFPIEIGNININDTFDISGQDAFQGGIREKPDGAKFFTLGQTNDRIYQYVMSTPWDISTASYDSKSFLLTNEATDPRGFYVRRDTGSKFYVADLSNDTIYQYSMSTPWDISTGSYDSKSFTTGTEADGIADVILSSDGTKMFVSSANDNRIAEYLLSTPWDVSTASYTGEVIGGFYGFMWMNSTDEVLYIHDYANNELKIYELSTPADLSTESLVDTIDISSSNTQGVMLKSDESKLYLADPSTADEIQEFDFQRKSTPSLIAQSGYFDNEGVYIVYMSDGTDSPANWKKVSLV